MRPSQGRISLQDTMALSPSLDTCGWFARDVPTFARVADVLLGQDAQPLPDHIRLLAPSDMWALATPGALKALKPVRQKIEQCLGKAKPVRVMNTDLDTMYWHFRAIQGREAWDVHGGFLQRFQPVLGAAVAQRFDWSSQVTDEQVAKARAFRDVWRTHMQQILGTDGVLLMPTMPDVPLDSPDRCRAGDLPQPGHQFAVCGRHGGLAAGDLAFGQPSGRTLGHLFGGARRLRPQSGPTGRTDPPRLVLKPAG
jgi:amidase